MFEAIDSAIQASNRNHTAMDIAHAMFIHGWVLAAKPKNILELGVGTGFVTRLLLAGIEFNQVGNLTCVDTWLDNDGIEPEFIKEIRDKGVKFVSIHEREFCSNCNPDEFDMLISDADHHGTWLDLHLKIVKNNGIMFFHDTNNPEGCKELYSIEDKVKELGCCTYHFKNNTRPDENCHRGLLMVINHKELNG